MKEILLWIWQLPQNLIGFIISRFCIKQNNIDGNITFYCSKYLFNSAVSLGNYIIINFLYYGSSFLETTLKHEHGHQIQSKYLGWFYLLVVGIPSLCGNIIDRVFHKKWDYEKRYKWYYSRFPENWADKLGDVKR